jgi:4-alpha-glucanotransferase
MHVDYAAVMRLKRPVLEALHRCSPRPRSRRRPGTPVSPVRREPGAALTDFATFVALDEHFRARGVTSWREWPRSSARPAPRGSLASARAHADAIDFHRWVQFELDEQLAAGAADARALGLSVGLYQIWRSAPPPPGATCVEPGLFLTGASVGARPIRSRPRGRTGGFPRSIPSRSPSRATTSGRRSCAAPSATPGRCASTMCWLFRQFWIPRGWR